MTPTGVDTRVVVDRTAWVRQLIAAIQSLPLDSPEAFRADARNQAAAESYLRRALEALLDLGRHVLAKGFGDAVVEYKAIARGLRDRGVLSQDDAVLLREMAGYRNRMVHFYDAVTDDELFEVCTGHLDDVGRVLDAIVDWVDQHPEHVRSA